MKNVSIIYIHGSNFFFKQKKGKKLSNFKQKYLGMEKKHYKNI